MSPPELKVYDESICYEHVSHYEAHSTTSVATPRARKGGTDRLEPLGETYTALRCDRDSNLLHNNNQPLTVPGVLQGHQELA
eukprot:1819803-Prymnesium_polylepis.1